MCTVFILNFNARKKKIKNLMMKINRLALLESTSPTVADEEIG